MGVKLEEWNYELPEDDSPVEKIPTFLPKHAKYLLEPLFITPCRNVTPLFPAIFGGLHPVFNDRIFPSKLLIERPSVFHAISLDPGRKKAALIHYDEEPADCLTIYVPQSLSVKDADKIIAKILKNHHLFEQTIFWRQTVRPRG